MRAAFAQALIERAARASLVLLTGDLGYLALEKVREALGPRFINAGVAEQNMMSLAAGLAREGFVPLVYSIAPFAVLRPLEQFRNDVCLHHLPVKVVGNGGGFGYGIMGATHHTLEDVAVMRAMPDVKVLVPTFAADVAAAVDVMLASGGPAYLRLNLPAKPVAAAEPFAPWRRLCQGSRAVVVGMGPVLGNVFELDPAVSLDVWAAGELPLAALPDALVHSVRATGRLLVIEEHGEAGGLYEALAARLLPLSERKLALRHVCARQSGAYGSQRWHQEESALAGPALEQTVADLLAEKAHGF